MPAVDLRKVRYALEIAQRKAFMLCVEEHDAGDGLTYGDVLAQAQCELDKFSTDEIEASLPEDFEYES